MQLPTQVIDLINNSTGKTLATMSDDGPNVIPVSMVSVVDNQIYINDCFMDKTRLNIQKDHRAALAFWSGLVGVQLKGTVDYQTEGEVFDQRVLQLKESHPDRTLCGVLIFSPEKIFDISPSNAGAVIAP